MRKTYTKLFLHHPELVDEMVKLRLEGWSYPALAKKYNCNHSSIIDWCYKRGVPRVQIHIPSGIKFSKMEVSLEKSLYNPTQFENVEMNITHEKICEGKSYQEYILEEKNRKYNKLLSNLTSKGKGI